MDSLQVGSGVRIDGMVEEYPAGSRQVRIERLLPAQIEDFVSFLPQAKRDLGEMREEFQQVLAAIEDPYLSELLHDLFSSEPLASTFYTAPAAKKYHHACVGGLLEHTLAVVRLCSFVADEHSEMNRDLLLAAAILHDVGKATSYALGPVLDLTDEGRLIEHVVAGALLVQQGIDHIEGFPQELRHRLLHAILAHHGSLERGSPVEPKTLEALAVHHADWMDGDLRGFIDAVESGPLSPDGWTEYVRMFGRRLYTGSREASEGFGEQEESPF
jgi:3'-5' exoribonuclease